LRPVSCDGSGLKKPEPTLLGEEKNDSNHQQQDAVPFYKEKGITEEYHDDQGRITQWV